jgi:hypothetical protein
VRCSRTDWPTDRRSQHKTRLDSNEKIWRYSRIPELSVAREWLVKTLQAGKCLADTVVNCEMWRSSVALYLLVVPSGDNKFSF